MQHDQQGVSMLKAQIKALRLALIQIESGALSFTAMPGHIPDAVYWATRDLIIRATPFYQNIYGGSHTDTCAQSEWVKDLISRLQAARSLKRSLKCLSETTDSTQYPRKSEFGCIALLLAGGPGVDYATRYIDAQLGGNHITMATWLARQGHAASVQHDMDHNQGRLLQRHRRAWVKRMINELQFIYD